MEIEPRALPYKKGNSVSSWSRWIRQWDLQLMVVPAMIFIFVFSYLPMYGVLMAFQDYQLFGGFFKVLGSG